MITSRTATLCGLGKGALASLLVALVCFSAWAARSPSLHHWLHTDQESPAHKCFVTTLSEGQTEVSGSATFCFVPQPFTFAAPPAPLTTHSALAHLLPETRGPPLFS